MRHLIFVAIFSFFIANANAASSIPSYLVGVWATEGSEFRGEALMKGQALYLDTDGVGGVIAGDGEEVLGVRIVVTSYNPITKTLYFYAAEYGKVIFSGTFTYDSTLPAIFSTKDLTQSHDLIQRYLRRFDGVTPEVRKSIGLEAITR